MSQLSSRCMDFRLRGIHQRAACASRLAALLISIAVLATCRFSDFAAPSRASGAESALAPAEERLLECQVTAVVLDTLVRELQVSAIALEESTFVEPTIVGKAMDIERVDSALVTDSATSRWLTDTLGLESSTISDFVHVNVPRSASCTTLTTRVPSFTFRLADYRTLRVGRHNYFDWKTFRALHPGALVIGASRVGFSADGRKALVTVRISSGVMCASGWIFSLARDDRGEWRVRGRYMLWVT